MASQKRVNYKVILLGDTAVGKTNLLTRLSSDEFSEDYRATIGVEFIMKSFKMNDQSTVKAQIWDTAGQERYATMMTAYYRKARGALIVFSLTDPKSLRGVDKWREYLLQHAGDDVSIVLVGNKVDAIHEQRINSQEVRRYASELGIPYFETSAKTGENVLNAFQAVVQLIHNEEKLRKQNEALIERMGQNVVKDNIPTDSFRLENNNNNNSSRSTSKSNGCCDT